MQANVLTSDASWASYLQRDEQVIWTGRPVVGGFVRAGSWFFIRYGLMWTGFASFWTVAAIKTAGPWFFWVLRIPFVLIGLYGLFGHFVVAARAARRTVYAVTDRRVLILTGAFRSSLTSLGFDSLPRVRVTEGADGVGTIWFGRTEPYVTSNGGWPGIGGTSFTRSSFIAIERVSDVARLIDGAKSDRTR